MIIILVYIIIKRETNNGTKLTIKDNIHGYDCYYFYFLVVLIYNLNNKKREPIINKESTVI